MLKTLTTSGSIKRRLKRKLFLSPHGHILHDGFASGVLNGVGYPLSGCRPGHVNNRVPSVTLQVNTLSLTADGRNRSVSGEAEGGGK